MFNDKSPTIACPACGRKNRSGARFCEFCAARLGAEPSIGLDTTPSKAPAARDAQGDSRFDAPRTVHSRPSSLAAAPASNASFWVKFGIAGLVVLIGFIAWSLYILTGSKAPAQLPAGQASVPAVSTGSTASPSLASNPDATAAPGSSSGAAATPPTAAPSGMAATPRAPVTTPSPTAAEMRAARPVAPSQRQPVARERTRAAPQEVRPADFGGWVEPSREPAMTSSPGYQDAGPPVVAGPGPREPMAITPSPAPGSGSSVSSGRPDLGPPVTVGPGPRYDYSTPNAAGR